MERIHAICNHPVWKESVEKIQALEQERIFCKHNPQHFLDVARLAWIENLEKDLEIEKELIYAAGLLHDIGRHLQYEKGIPHDKGSAMLAEKIMEDCGFTKKEQEEVLSAILQHRIKETRSLDSFAGLIYRADKASRACLFCSARNACNWDEEKKNLKLTV